MNAHQRRKHRRKHKLPKPVPRAPLSEEDKEFQRAFQQVGDSVVKHMVVPALQSNGRSFLTDTL